MTSRNPDPNADTEAVQSLRSSIEAHDRMIADLDRLLPSRRERNDGACEGEAAEAVPPPGDRVADRPS